MPANPDLSELKIIRDVHVNRNSQFRNRRRWISLVIFILGTAVAWSAWNRYAPIGIYTVGVSTVYPTQELTVLNATGYVVAQRKASVASKATGRLEWLGVLEGSPVHMGEIIARLERGDTEALRDQAAANVRLAEANLSQGQVEVSEAELAFNRSDALFNKKLVSDAVQETVVGRLNKARAVLMGLEASVAVARANLRVYEVALDQTFIRAPFDGIVLTRNANVGDTITPFSQAVDTRGAVVTIADMDTIEVEADVAESSFLGIYVGQAVEIQLDALPGQRFEGVVSRIVPTIDRAKASLLVKIRFLQHDPRMLPDMSAKIAFLKREISEAERNPVVAIPTTAVFEADGFMQVDVIVDGKAYKRRADLGAKIGDRIVVHNFEIGTRIVTNPSNELFDGRAVRELAK